ncbi:MAG: sucrose synthase, partial [Verrucomicrobia bacterium]|nr:sucrose synthase [Verrucomicrobiota bacterium]
MPTRLEEWLKENPGPARSLLRTYLAGGRAFLLRSDLVDALDAFCATDEGAPLRDGPLAEVLRRSQEAVVDASGLGFAVRPRIGVWTHLMVDPETLACREITAREFLRFRERLAGRRPDDDTWLPELDLRPFERGFPRLRETRSIGRGAEFLNRELSGRLFHQMRGGEEPLVEFLRLHQYDGQPLLLSPRIGSPAALRENLEAARSMIEAMSPDTPAARFRERLERLGFEPGWGRDAAGTLEMMGHLADLLESPSPHKLEAFLALVPMIFRLAIVSPHGYFGQSGVLGLPDTGGQVVYILDQVRALEREMRESLAARGLTIEPRIVIVTRLIPDARGTPCDQPREPVNGTRSATILRLPFRDRTGRVVPEWIPRFRVWPFLERFAADVEKELSAELGGKPDFVIGNYSDGNLVASLLCARSGVTQCNIAHALEKTKYLYSDLHWKDLDPEYHFSCQFTADLIAM